MTTIAFTSTVTMASAGVGRDGLPTALQTVLRLLIYAMGKLAKKTETALITTV